MNRNFSQTITIRCDDPAPIIELLAELPGRSGTAVVLVTHEPRFASYADRVVFLADGRIVDGIDAPTAARVLERMKSFDGTALTARNGAA